MALDALEAVRVTLANHLRGALVGTQIAPGKWHSLQVRSEWPQPNEDLAAGCVSVITPPIPPEVTEHAPKVWSTTPTSQTMGSVIYSTGIAKVAVQVDVWANTPGMRDELSPDVLGALKRPASDTMGIAPWMPRLARSPALFLRSGDYYDAPIAYRLTPIPGLNLNSDAAQTADWRSTWTGTAELYLLADQTVPIIRQIIGRFSTNGGAVETVALSR